MAIKLLKFKPFVTKTEASVTGQNIILEIILLHISVLLNNKTLLMIKTVCEIHGLPNPYYYLLLQLFYRGFY